MKAKNALIKSDSIIVAICALLALWIFIIDSFIPLGVAGGVPYILVVLISLWSHRTQLPIYMAIVGSALTILGVFTSPIEGEIWKVLANRLLALFAIWVVAILSVQRKKISEIYEEEFEKLRQFRGFLSICTSCGMIRDDLGLWVQTEVYIRDKIGFEISHCLCPDCEKRTSLVAKNSDLE